MYQGREYCYTSEVAEDLHQVFSFNVESDGAVELDRNHSKTLKNLAMIRRGDKAITNTYLLQPSALRLIMPRPDCIQHLKGLAPSQWFKT